VLDTILKDEKKNIGNKMITVKENSSVKISGKSGVYKLDFIHVTHSTLQCTNIAFHTPEGIFYYAVDFKLDDTPVMGSPPNYKKMLKKPS
ncbi:unnamed protein product, partial [marine sediment metagenome]